MLIFGLVEETAALVIVVYPIHFGLICLYIFNSTNKIHSLIFKYIYFIMKNKMVSLDLMCNILNRHAILALNLLFSSFFVVVECLSRLIPEPYSINKKQQMQFCMHYD